MWDVLNDMLPFSDNFVIDVLVTAAVAAGITLFFIKLTGKDDRDLNRSMFRAIMLVTLTNAIVHYSLHGGKDAILTEPFLMPTS